MLCWCYVLLFMLLFISMLIFSYNTAAYLSYLSHSWKLHMWIMLSNKYIYNKQQILLQLFISAAHKSRVKHVLYFISIPLLLHICISHQKDQSRKTYIIVYNMKHVEKYRFNFCVLNFLQFYFYFCNINNEWPRGLNEYYGLFAIDYFSQN